MLRTLAAHLRAQWMGALALFLVLAGGTAYAANTVFSTDIVNGEVKTPDLASNAVGTGKVANNSLTGSDIVESSLGEVPSARLGGLGGKSPVGGTCDPESTAFITCAQTDTVTLAAPTRVLIIGTIRAGPEAVDGAGAGFCHVGTNAGSLQESQTLVDVKDQNEVSMSGITDVLGPGPIAFGLDCDEGAGGIVYVGGHINYVELLPGQP